MKKVTFLGEITNVGRLVGKLLIPPKILDAIDDTATNVRRLRKEASFDVETFVSTKLRGTRPSFAWYFGVKNPKYEDATVNQSYITLNKTTGEVVSQAHELNDGSILYEPSFEDFARLARGNARVIPQQQITKPNS